MARKIPLKTGLIKKPPLKRNNVKKIMAVSEQKVWDKDLTMSLPKKVVSHILKYLFGAKEYEDYFFGAKDPLHLRKTNSILGRIFQKNEFMKAIHTASETLQMLNLDAYNVEKSHSLLTIQEYTQFLMSDGDDFPEFGKLDSIDGGTKEIKGIPSKLSQLFFKLAGGKKWLFAVKKGSTDKSKDTFAMALFKQEGYKAIFLVFNREKCMVKGQGIKLVGFLFHLGKIYWNPTIYGNPAKNTGQKGLNLVSGAERQTSISKDGSKVIFEGWTQDKAGAPSAKKVTVKIREGTNEIFEDWSRDKAGNMEAKRRTVELKDGKKEIYEDWSRDKAGREKAKRRTVELKDGKKEIYEDWSRDKAGREKAKRRTIEFKDGKTIILEDWSRDKAGTEKAKWQKIEYKDGTKAIYEIWTQEKPGNFKATMLTIEYKDGTKEIYEDWTQDKARNRSAETRTECLSNGKEITVKNWTSKPVETKKTENLA